MRNYNLHPLKIGEKIDQQDLYELYINQNLSANKIASICNCSSDKVYANLKFYQIKKSKELINKAKSELWKNKSKEELQEMINKIKNTFRLKTPEQKQARIKAIKSSYYNKSEEEKRLIYEKQRLTNNLKSKEEKQAIINKCKAAWNNKSEEERELIIKRRKEAWKNKSKEEKELIKQKHKKYWQNLSQEQLENWKKQVSKNSKMMWQNRSDEQINTTRTKMSKKALERESNMSEEQRQNRINKFKQTYYSAKEDVRIARNLKNSLAKKLYWQNISELDLAHRSNKYKETMSAKSSEEKNQIQEKIYETKKKNKSFNQSKPEKRLLYELKTLYPDVKYQWRDKQRYPFSADIYIPSLDLFIEFNFMWTHGREPYNEHDTEHQKQLKIWIQKAEKSAFYKNAIYTWTDLDVRKRHYAEKHNLNWLCFYSEQDFINWFNKQKGGNNVTSLHLG